MRARQWVELLAYYNAAWNLLLFALNPAWASMVLAWMCMIVGAFCTFRKGLERRRLQASQQRHPPLYGGPVLGARAIVVGPHEAIVPIVPARQKGCQHKRREPVILSTGEVVGWVCIHCLERVTQGGVPYDEEKHGMDYVSLMSKGVEW